MSPLISIIMGSTSDLPVMEKACNFLNDMQIPFEVNALSAHRTPALTKALAKLGYPIARRTVAKYREQLGLPVARLRKS